MNIAIVEDMHVDSEILKAQLMDYASARRLKLDIDIFESAEELLADYQPLKYTVIFLNVYFQNGMNGPEAAEILRDQDNYTLLVFLTSSKDHMPNAFKVHAYDYIEKPIDSSRLFQMMDDLLKQIHVQPEIPRMHFISQRKEYSLPYSEIISVATTANYLEITERTGSVFRTRMTFASAYDQLSKDPRFLLIMRGILVNMDYIIDISEKTCHMEGDIFLPINIRNSKKIEQIWNNYIFAKKRQETLEKGRI